MVKNKEKITFRIFIVTIFTWLLVGILMLILYVFFIPPFAVWTLLFDRKRKIAMFYLTRFFIKLFFFLYVTSNFTIDLGGIKKNRRPRVYMLNHASQFDTFLIYLLPGRLKALVKYNYIKWPFIGWTIWLNGNIYVKKAKDEFNYQLSLLKEAKSHILDGVSLIIFPEGTKSKDGNISRFKNGGFVIAHETKAEIVPVVLDTWNSIRPGGGGWIRDDKIWMKILRPITYEEYKEIDIKDFAKMLKIKMAEELIKIRNQRRKLDKNYYRNEDKYIRLDEEAENKVSGYKKKTQILN